MNKGAIQRAIQRLVARRRVLNRDIRNLRLQLDVIAKAVKPPTPRKKKGKMSAAGRAKVAAAQRKRWGAYHARLGKRNAVSKKGRRKRSAAAHQDERTL